MRLRLSHWFSNEVKKTWQLGLPLIGSQLVYAASGFMSTVFVARLGKEALAASVLVSSLSLTLTIFFFSIISAIAVLIAHEYGAERHTQIRNILGQAYWYGLAIIALIYLALSAFPALLQFSHQSPTVLALARDYLSALYWMIPGLILLLIAEHFFAGIGQGNMVLRISLVIVPIEIPLIYALVLGKGGLPACGVKGVGYGLGITYTLAALIVTGYLARAKRYRDYTPWRDLFRFDMPLLQDFLRIGLPFGLLSIVEFSTFAVAAYIMSSFGAISLAAHQIVLQYLGLVITFVLAMSQATSIRVGQVLGRGDTQHLKAAVFAGMTLNLFFIVPIMLAYVFIPHWLVGLDVDSSQPSNLTLISQTSVLLSISGVLLFFDNFRIIGTGALRGLKDTQAPLYLSAVALWLVGVCSCLMLGINAKMGAPGVWWGLTLGIACGAALIIWRLRWLVNQKNA